MKLSLGLSTGVLALVLAGSAAAQSVTRARLINASPTRVSQAAAMTAEIDALGGRATGSVTFSDGATALGAVALSGAGAGQATMTTGLRHSCSLTSANGVKCWGENTRGQIGDGTLINRAAPVAVTGLSSGVVAVVAGAEHSCALTALGAVKCWGNNSYGQLGDGTTTPSPTAVQVAGLESGAVAISAGDYHTCALTDAGSVMCWGYNSYGQLGNGATNTGYTPTAVAGPATIYTSLAVATRHTCAVTSVGAVKCWGFNGNGELGDGTGVNRAFPTQVSGLTSGVTALSADGSHSCAVKAGALRCWGINTNGEIGDGTTTNRLAPVAVTGLAAGVATVDAGAYHTCALTTAGAVQCWGRNSYGALGDGTAANRLTPTPVSTLGGVAIAISSGGEHSCALLNTRAVKCWGYNYYGQVGDGTNTNRLLPSTAAGVSGVLRARAKLSVTTLGAGWHLLQAAYPGDATHSGSSAASPQLVQ